MANSFEPQSKSIVDWLAERTNRDGRRLTQLEITRLGKVWIPVGQLSGIYTWQGTFTDAGDPYYTFQYQLYDKDHLRVKGAITGGTNGTVGFTLLPPFWPTKRTVIFGSVEVTGSVQIAVLDIATNGEVTINW